MFPHGIVTYISKNVIWQGFIDLIKAINHHWPSFLLLSGMALADILLDIEYVPFILYMSFPHLIAIDNAWEKNSWGWSAYMIFHAHFSVIIHNVSIWLTLSVAIWRFIMIRFHHLVPVYCTIRRCHILLFCAYGKFVTREKLDCHKIVPKKLDPQLQKVDNDLSWGFYKIDLDLKMGKFVKY